MPKKHTHSQKYSSETFSLNKYIFIVFAVILVIGAGQTLAQSRGFVFDKPFVKVLGDTVDSQDTPQPQETQNPQEAQQNGGNDTQNAQEQAKQAQEKAQEQAKQAQEKALAAQKEMEIQTSDGAKIKIKKEDNNLIKVELEKGTLHYKYQSIQDSVVKNVETATDEAVLVSRNQLDKLETHIGSELDKEGIEISTESGETKISKNGVSATTIYPLSVGKNGGSLALTTPEGDRSLRLSPDQVILSLLNSGRIASASAGAASQDIKIVLQNNQPMYEVNGQKVYHFLGLFDLTQPLKFTVSAETGNVVGTQQTVLGNLLSLFSF